MYCSLLKINLQGVLSCKFTAAYMSAKKIHRWKEDGRPCSGCLWQVPPRRSFFFFFTRGCCGQWRISISDRKTDAYVFWILISHCVSVTAVLLFIGYSPSCRSRSCSRLTTGRKVVYALKEDFCRAHCSFHAHMEGKSKLYRSRMQIELLVLQTVYTNWTD